MPYASDRQRRFMHARHPDIAKRWDREEHERKRKLIRKRHAASSSGRKRPAPTRAAY